MADIGAIELVIALAHDYSVETRVRRLIEEHEQAGERPRTLVMNVVTWHQLVDELDGRTYNANYFWAPLSGRPLDPLESITTFYGLPILIKDYVADQLVLVGV